MRSLLSIAGNEQSDRPAAGTLTEAPAIDRERRRVLDRVRELAEECVRLHARPPVRSAVPAHRHGSRAPHRSVRPAATVSEPVASGSTETHPRKVSQQNCRHAPPVPELSYDRTPAT